MTGDERRYLKQAVDRARREAIRRENERLRLDRQAVTREPRIVGPPRDASHAARRRSWRESKRRLRQVAAHAENGRYGHAEAA